MKESRSKKGMHLLRQVKPSMRKAIWIFSSMLAVFTLVLMIFFHLYESDKTYADTETQNQPVAPGNQKATALSYENLSGNTGHPTQLVMSHYHDINTDGKADETKKPETTIRTQSETGKDDSKTVSDDVINFKAAFNNQQVNFSWTTAPEINHGIFTIERSFDGEHFEEIICKPELVNSAAGSVYSATEEHLVYETSYYRLKYSQQDGHIMYSASRKVTNHTEVSDITELNIVSFGPNPFTDKLRVTFTQQVAFEVDFELINSAGSAVFIDIINAHEGTNQYEFTDQKRLPNGTYYMSLLYNHKKQVRKIIKN